MWKKSFSHVKIREYKQVTGKCWDCYHINEGRKKAETTAEMEAFKYIHLLHRGGLYMTERKKYVNNYTDLAFLRSIITQFTIFRYRERVAFATRPENQKKVLSMIIDGMDQSHSNIPNLGNSQTFPEVLKQHITGVLVHGVGKLLADIFYYIKE